MSLRALLVVCALLFVGGEVKADPIVIGQVDTFQAGPQGWHVGGGGPFVPATPLPTVPTGGPAGAGDSYLLLSSTGLSETPGGRLVGINTAQWAGDYTGVGAITVDFNNLGTSDLSLRLLLAAGPFGPFGPENIVITSAFTLPAGSGWTSHTFSLAPGDLFVLAGSAEAALAGAFELRIFHSPGVGFPGPAVNAQLGVDNIRAAAAVPEPTTVLLLGTGLAGVVGAARRRRRR